MTDHFFAAADLGASSGRVMMGCLTNGRVLLEEVHRFTTSSFTQDGHLHWDTDDIRHQIITGLKRAGEKNRLEGVAVDTWGVDYGRLDASGTVMEAPFHYRDSRTQGVPEAFFAKVPASELYSQCGLQTMDFNTIFQYLASAGDPRWADVDTCLFLPDLFTYWLSGAKVAELTIASTSGLLDVEARNWSATTLAHVRDYAGIDLTSRLPAIVTPGTVVGTVAPAVLDAGVPMIAVGSHDTASAIAAIPAASRQFGYISSGTWSLVGLELDHPILTEESRAADFTNELGVDATVRYLRNVMGLWVLSESQRRWAEEGLEVNLLDLLQAAARLPALRTVVDMEDPRLLPPGDMPARLAQMARETDQVAPLDPAECTRVILDSLAVDYRRVIRQACQLSNTHIDVIHIVGGGCRNQLLNQLTAEATGLPVVAGPAESTALGSILVQARAVGALSGDLMDLRQVSRASVETQTYSPGVLDLPEATWAEAERRLGTF